MVPKSGRPALPNGAIYKPLFFGLFPQTSHAKASLVGQSDSVFFLSMYQSDLLSPSKRNEILDLD
jgi:hypothetical protein